MSKPTVTTPNEFWNEAYKQRPINPACEREIEIMIVGKRCIYINDLRVQGGKPYVSENLPHERRTTTLRSILDAFTDLEIRAYLEEKIAIDAYCAGLRNFRDAAFKDIKP